MSCYPHSSTCKTFQAACVFAVWPDWSEVRGGVRSFSATESLGWWLKCEIHGSLGFPVTCCDLRHRITLLINVDYCVMFELWGFQDALQHTGPEQSFPSGVRSQGLLGVKKCLYEPLYLDSRGIETIFGKLCLMLENCTFFFFFNNWGHFF